MSIDENSDKSVNDWDKTCWRKELDNSDGQMVRNASSEQVEAARALNLNQPDGSLRHYQVGVSGESLADQSKSIELVEGDVIVSRTRPGHEDAFIKSKRLPQVAYDLNDAQRDLTSLLKGIEKSLGADEKTSGKPKAPEGKDISLNDFFHKYSSSLADAYNQSKALKPGEPGNSPTLEAIVDRMFAIPWADKLKIRIDRWARNSEYNNSENTLVVHPNKDPLKYLQNAGHEAYHASHQFLSKLYGEKPVSNNEYVRIKVDGEVEAILHEIEIGKELGAKGARPVYFEQEPAPEREHLVNLEDLYAKRGREGLYQFLLDARPANHKPSYRETFAMAYPEYVKDF